MEDTDIVALYWRRDPEAVRESQRKYGRMLHSIAYNILSSREDSEECVNDVYVKAWDSMPPQQPGSLCAYLGRITRNISINRWQSKRAKKRGGAEQLLSELSDCVPSSESVEDQADAGLLKNAVIRWLLELPPDDRALFLRRYWFGDSLRVLSAECETAPNRLAGRMFRLRTRLKKFLESEGIFL